MSDFKDAAADPLEEAAEWFARLQSDAAGESDWLGFESWLLADPANPPAFYAVERLWVDLDHAPPPATLTEPATAVVLPFTKRPTRVSWGVWLATGSVAAALAVGVITPRLLKPVQTEPLQTIVTAKNERKLLTLADGTKLELNGGSRVDYRFGKSGRWAKLVQGEVAFTVVHDATQPFEVDAGDRRITDVGTVFDVARLDHAVRVTVQQGIVAVDSAAARLGVTVTAGWQLTHNDGEVGSKIEAVDAQNAMAWRSGRLIYRDAPLQTVVSDLNRYFPTPIRVKDRQTAELRFSGVLVLDSEGAVVSRLQAFMPVAVVRESNAFWVSGRR